MTTRLKLKTIAALMCATSLLSCTTVCQAVSVEFAGSHLTLEAFFPGETLPYVTVPWRTSHAGNTFATSTDYPDQYYGRDGYALFTTNFSYPNQNLGTAGGWMDFQFSEAAGVFKDIIDLPGFVSDSLILSAGRAGGWEYSLIDDPQLMFGERYWTFDGANYPAPTGDNDTGQNPYVKLGVLSGWDRFGNNPALPEALPAGRWGFQVGADVPDSFRLGVMADGYDGDNRAPKEIFLARISELGSATATIFESASTGELFGDRKVDMHFFDIHDAQEGDIFAVGVKSYSDNTIGAVSGFTFDILPTTPSLTGDYNDDGTVDAVDYAIWRENLGTAFELPNRDPANTGDVGSADYTTWRDNYGQTTALGPQAGAAPEPSAAFALLAALGMAAARRYRPVKPRISKPTA